MGSCWISAYAVASESYLSATETHKTVCQTTTPPPLSGGSTIISSLFLRMKYTSVVFLNILRLQWYRYEMLCLFSTSLFNHFVYRCALTRIMSPFRMFRLNLEKWFLHCGLNIGMIMDWYIGRVGKTSLSGNRDRLFKARRHQYVLPALHQLTQLWNNYQVWATTWRVFSAMSFSEK